jgi:hypothetical protein
MDINERLDKIESSLASLVEFMAETKKSQMFRPIFSPTLINAPPPPPPPPPPPIVQIFKEELAPPPMPPVVENPVAPVVEQSVPNVGVKPPIELINLLNSKEWPPAVDPALICDISSEQDKEDRAEGILDLIIDIHLENLKFLDFGCGEGHVVNRSVSQNPRMSVGYDITEHDKWNQWTRNPKMLLTTDWGEVKAHTPFNIVLMYDVIDHIICSDAELIAKLAEIKSMLAPNGKIYLRAHPWCSRHGTHLYRQLNKAYAHIVFSDDELQALGYKQEPVRKVKTPIITYEALFKAAGLKIKSGAHQIKEGVEPFFMNKPLVTQRIKSAYKDVKNEEWQRTFPTTPLENQFIDYVLT